MIREKIITVFGGSGFIGRHLVKRLSKSGALIRVAVRDVSSANYLRSMGEVGQIVPVATDIGDKRSVAVAVDGVEEVVNLVGVLWERGSQNFSRIHITGAENIAEAALAAGVRKMVHVSAIGANPDSNSKYAKTKGIAETKVFSNFKNAVVLRPSVIFGPEDSFFNRFASIARVSPLLPVFGCSGIPTVSIFTENGLFEVDLYGHGGTKFQPIYVGDVAKSIVAALSSEVAQGNIYELGGPNVYSSKELMELILNIIKRKRLLAPLPFWYLSILASFLGFLPNPLITHDQVKLLRHDNVVSSRAKKIKNLGIIPIPAEAVLPSYLTRFRVNQGG